MASLKKVRKAVIPIAGLGTRMYPATKSVMKVMLPVVSSDGVCKPVLQTILEEAWNAGVEEMALIVRPGDEVVIRHFLSPVDEPLFNRLPDQQKQEELKLREFQVHTTFLYQEQQLGLGHAVSLAREWAGNEPVLLLLGDHIFYSNEVRNCAKQLLDAYQSCGAKTIISFYPVPGEQVHHYGTATGDWMDEEHRTLKLSEFAEKPSLEYARTHLAMQGMAQDTFLCVYGQYVLTPEVFQILDEQIRQGMKQKNEFQLTPALDALRKQSGICGFVVNGEHYDTGQPRSYVESLQAYSQIVK